jgi:hypothetical protein
VRTDLFTELGGFDPATFPGAEDLDLCWRARLAGARVLVVPDARATHREAATDRLRDDRPDEFAMARSRVRVLFTSYSFHKLLWLVPVGFVVGFVEAIGDLLVGRPRRARAAIGSWFSNLLHVRRLRPSRRRAQALRTVHDSDLRELQVSSTARMGAFFAHHLHTDTRLRTLGDASRSAVDSVSDGMRTPAAIAFLAFLVMVVVGSRSLITGGVPAIGTFAHWPGVGDVFDAFGSAWRYTGLGSASPAPAALGVIGAFGTVLLGATALAQTLTVVVSLPLGAVGAYRLGRHTIGFRGPALAAGLAYGISPVARNALAQGRLGPLVLFALLPFLLLRVVRLGERSDVRRGRVLRLAVACALLGAWYPAGLGLFALAVLACVVAVPIAGRARAMLRAFGIAIVATVGALVLLFPWPLAYAHAGTDKASLGFAFRPVLDLSQVLRFDTGPASAGWVMWGLIVAAAVPLFVATGDRLAWTARGWVLALVGWAAVWVPARFFPDTSVLAPEAGLTLAALGLALCVGITVSVFVDGIHTFRFGWRQPAAIIGAVAIVLPALAFTADVFDGRWDAPAHGWAKELAFTSSATNDGEFRMLWAGDPTELPLDPVVLRDGTGYVLTRNGPGDVTEQWRAPEHDADLVLDRALGLAESGRTDRLGRMLAPMGVRYVVVPSTQGPDGGAAADAPVGLRRALAQQLDLVRLRSSRGLELYQNLAYAPIRAAVPPPALPVDSRRPNRAALATDLTRAVPLPSGPTSRGTAFWGEAYDSEWKATGGGDALRHQEPFGWANGFVVDQRATVSISYEAQWVRWAMLAGALVIWVLVLWRWRRTRVRRDPSTRNAASRARRERAVKPDPLAELDDEAFWWERV